MRPHPDLSARGDTGRFSVVVFAACLALKSVLIAVDDRVRLFMGDSATYLWSAITLTAPSDRSYSYPLFIRAIAAPFGSIDPLLWAQTLCGVATATMIAWLLREVFAARRCVAFGAALLVCLDPLQLFYERMVMTESLSTCVLLASLCVAVAYVRNGRAPLLIACVLIGIVSASLRVGLVPLAVCLGTTAALLRWDTHGHSRIARHVVLAVVLTCAGHTAYRHLYGIVTHGPAAYIRDGGLFRLGLVAPLVRADDFEGTRVDPSLLGDVTIPLADEKNREAQIWSPGGLVDVLERHAGTRAFKVASKIAAHAMHRDPLGFVRLGLATTADYFNAPLRNMRLYSDLGSGQLPDAATLTLLKVHFGYDASNVARSESAIYRYFAASWVWPITCLFALAPLSLLAALVRRSRAALLLALVGCGLVVGQVLCSHIVSFRYLHPFSVLVIANGAVLVDAWLARWTLRIRGEPPAFAALDAHGATVAAPLWDAA